MAKYNLKQVIKISKSDFYPTDDYYFTKKNLQPIRNLFRKKKNRKYVEGWVYSYSLENTIIQENEIKSPYVIIDGKCFEKPVIKIFFTNDFKFYKYFDSYRDTERFEKKIIDKLGSQFEKDKIIEL
jgi:hypothetical protein